jgi:hypothetical protein
MNIIYLLIVILVPIIPAYLLFKKLKSSAEASGPISPIKEFSVKFGGAFAGYFPIFLLLYFKLPNTFEEIKQSQPWEITGTIKDADTKKIIEDPYGDLQVVLKPFSDVTDAGMITLYLLERKTPIGEEKLDYVLRIEDKKGIYVSTDAINLDDLKNQSKNSNKIQIPDSFLMLSKKIKELKDSITTSPIMEISN